MEGYVTEMNIAQMGGVRAPLGGYRDHGSTRLWAPVLDAVNTWVMVSNEANDEPCALNTEIESNTDSFNPQWGRDGTKDGTGYVKCCEVPYKNQIDKEGSDFENCSVPLFSSNNVLNVAVKRSILNGGSINKAFDSNSHTFWSSARNEISNWIIQIGGVSSGY